jgi:gamma-glutamylaminecyclotransferase
MDTANTEKKTVIFVYGTLKKGDCRAGVLGGGRFIGNARTTDAFTLYSCGSFPAMVMPEDKELQTGVHGELYEVPESLLDNRLDAIEGVPNLYDRGIAKIQSVETDNPEDAKITEAKTYIFQRSVKDLKHLGLMWDVKASRR